MRVRRYMLAAGAAATLGLFSAPAWAGWVEMSTKWCRHNGFQGRCWVFNPALHRAPSDPNLPKGAIRGTKREASGEQIFDRWGNLLHIDGDPACLKRGTKCEARREIPGEHKGGEERAPNPMP